jgi:8-oxo-dGTP pyrophosphatase MutT (NUDIX family)
VSTSLLQLIETRLASYRPRKKLLRPLMKRSAVALILQLRDDELHILMIKRAEREGDTWSGHMAFPGGRKDPSDRNGFACAVRETEEEVGLQLGENDVCIGRLSEVNALSRVRGFGMAVTPYVFTLKREVTFCPNYEVAEVVWVPLSFLRERANREIMKWKLKGMEIPLPAYYYEGRRIWGLSLNMLDELLKLIGND